ncbi:MAG: MBL fold metallo-hydrolase [Desulfuromonadales bacterium]|nr:MBL fold metallo-hydrolase [Desulfuromonadales bacterium]NIR34061.1 MBL fold metallo-hydrolase [Desulfuromonadales bacterium]NIS44112.1 MBL fold metallo-hydrolase [Desulfuromonadales bacterium]
MRAKLTILCENTVSRPMAAIAEHGFSCHIETPAGSFLFDSGQGLGIVRNARSLYKDLGDLSAIILSHGHYDHAGGLADVLQQTGPIDVHAHSGIFAERYWLGKESRRFIGIPHRRPYLESLGARFRWHDEFCEIAPGIYLSGEIPRTTSFEKGDPSMAVVGCSGEMAADPFVDDLALVVDSPKGLMVLLGCAHAGTINTLDWITKKLPQRPIHTIVGGTHLVKADDEQVEATLEALESFEFKRLGVAHCTGLEKAARMQQRFGNRFFFAGIGTELEV